MNTKSITEKNIKTKDFKDWVKHEKKENGLKYFHISATKDATEEEVFKSLLEAKQAISEGNVHEFPPISKVKPDPTILEMLKEVKL